MKKQTGFTLPELMISLLLGLIVVGTTITIYISTIRGSTDTIRSARLNHDMDSLMTLMVNDIKRAGYWGGAINGVDARTNPFTSDANNIQIIDDDCIVYSYDANDDGNVNNNEMFGFRLNNDGSVSMRLSGTTLASCADADGTWQRMTVSEGGEQVNITGLEFSFTPIAGTPSLPATSRCLNVTTDTIDNDIDCTKVPGDDIAQRRVVNIRLIGEMGRDATIRKTLVGTVKLGNDRLYQEP
ncbi:MAG: prepilin-type N-terminal cleavage/methylation domain-containing protein [Methylomicrobium sp.]|nr:prepilin-type N-terminal cleavage/methylation domain-containing protein [Methylomicrobium sp.]